jgi:hypothetical protein
MVRRVQRSRRQLIHSDLPCAGELTARSLTFFATGSAFFARRAYQAFSSRVGLPDCPAFFFAPQAQHGPFARVRQQQWSAAGPPEPIDISQEFECPKKI